MGNPESAAPRETHAAESLQKLFGGAEGQNSDFKTWRCDEEGVETGSWPGRGGGRGRVRGGLRVSPRGSGQTPRSVWVFHKIRLLLVIWGGGEGF